MGIISILSLLTDELGEFMLIVITSLMVLFFISKRIVIKVWKKIYFGKYLVHSLLSILFSSIILVIFYTIYFNSNNWGILNDIPYVMIIIPSTVIFFLVDLFVRTIIYKNSVLFVIVNTIFFLFIPILGIMMINSMFNRLGP